MIRGCGASTTSSRSSFFVTLAGFLKVASDVPVQFVFDILQTELSVGSGEDKVNNTYILNIFVDLYIYLIIFRLIHMQILDVFWYVAHLYVHIKYLNAMMNG